MPTARKRVEFGEVTVIEARADRSGMGNDSDYGDDHECNEEDVSTAASPLWYSRAELKVIKLEVLETIEVLNRSGRGGRRRSSLLSRSGYCSRGIESMKSHRARELRRTAIDAVISAVLEEQLRQFEQDIGGDEGLYAKQGFDAESIAKASASCSLPCQDRALSLGRKDAVVAHRYREEEQEHPSPAISASAMHNSVGCLTNAYEVEYYYNEEPETVERLPIASRTRHNRRIGRRRSSCNRHKNEDRNEELPTISMKEDTPNSLALLSSDDQEDTYTYRNQLMTFDRTEEEMEKQHSHVSGNETVLKVSNHHVATKKSSSSLLESGHSKISLAFRRLLEMADLSKEVVVVTSPTTSSPRPRSLTAPTPTPPPRQQHKQSSCPSFGARVPSMVPSAA